MVVHDDLILFLEPCHLRRVVCAVSLLLRVVTPEKAGHVRHPGGKAIDQFGQVQHLALQLLLICFLSTGAHCRLLAEPLRELIELFGNELVDLVLRRDLAATD